LQISRLSGEIYIDGTLVQEFTMKDVYDRFKKAQFYVDSNKLPNRDFVYNYPADLVECRYKQGLVSKKDYSDWKGGNKYISDWQCNYCPYLYACWKDIHGDAVRGADKASEEKITGATSDKPTRVVEEYKISKNEETKAKEEGKDDTK
jgi:hypothetical protein